MSILILADHNNVQLGVATRHAVSTAAQLGGEIHLLVAGHDCRAVADKAATLNGVTKVILVDDASLAEPLAERLAPLVVTLAKHYSHIISAATSTGKDVMPRLAALLDVGMISEATKILAPNRFERPIYAGNAIETLETRDAIICMTIRQAAFAAAGEGGAAAIEVVAAPTMDATVSRIVSREGNDNGKQDLASARIVIAGGRGVGSQENFHKLEALAAKLGAAVGASRAAVDAGFAPNDWQVGQTGKIVAPELYIAVGISGAIQHLAGMKESKVIVAINKDENAAIFTLADYGLVADWENALPQLVSALTGL